MEMADMTVDNNGTKEELYVQLDNIVAGLD
jgi:hypothetical protein